MAADIPKFESQSTEFKECWDSKKDGAPIKKTIVAFANTAGGDLYIGVSDDGTVVGLDDISDTEERLISAIQDNISPSVNDCVTTEHIAIEGKDVLRVHVAQGSARPYYMDPTNAQTVYVRVGNTSRPARIDELAKILRESNPVPYLERNCARSDLTFTKCMDFCNSRNVYFDPKANLQFGFWNHAFRCFTNLAYICSDQSNASVVLVQFADAEKTQILASKKVTGSIFSIYEETLSFVNERNIDYVEKPDDGTGERVEHYRISPSVIREALVNIIAHRDYEKKPAALVHITPKVIEFTSFGGLEDIEFSDITNAMATYCRNEKLAELLSKLHLMEGIGTGFLLIRQFYKRYKLSLEDLLEASKSSFTIRLIKPLPKIRYDLHKEERKYQKILEAIDEKGSMSRAEIQAQFGISQSGTVNLLKELLVKHRIVKEGNGKNTRYAIALEDAKFPEK
jgi:ATP-dependent DNA helicase RecG